MSDAPLPPIPPPPPIPPLPPKQDGQALAAIICSALGILCLLPAVAGIVLGVRSRNRIDASGGALGGRTLATAAIWVGVAMCAFYLAFTAYRFAT